MLRHIIWTAVGIGALVAIGVAEEMEAKRRAQRNG